MAVTALPGVRHRNEPVSEPAQGRLSDRFNAQVLGTRCAHPGREISRKWTRNDTGKPV